MIVVHCVNVVVTSRRGDCSGPSSHLVSAVNGTGYLSSLVTDRTGVGTADCPWLLRASSGQRISLSLLDFTAVDVPDGRERGSAEVTVVVAAVCPAGRRARGVRVLPTR